LTFKKSNQTISIGLYIQSRVKITWTSIWRWTSSSVAIMIFLVLGIFSSKGTFTRMAN